MADPTDQVVTDAINAINNLKTQRDDAQALAASETSRANTQQARADTLSGRLQSLIDAVNAATTPVL